MMNPANLSIGNSEWQALMPLVIMAVGAMISLMIGTFRFEALGSSRKVPVFLSGMVTVGGALAWLATHWVRAPVRTLQGMVVLDYFSSFFFLVVLVSALLVLLAGYRYLEDEEIHYSEYYSILLTAVFGMMCLAVTLELVTVFVALEIMSLAVYVLVGMRRFDKLSNEAAAKYFVMGGIASAVYLYGVALIYGALNTTNLFEIATALKGTESGILSNPVLVLGMAFVFGGFFFKVAVVPFHMWTPDVYEGAPIVITSFMSTALKTAAFAAFIRISSVFLGNAGGDGSAAADLFQTVLWVLAFATMLLGNLVALMQKNLKRMLAYSAIAHTGYLLLGILVGPKVGYSGIMIYLIPYTVMNIGAFAVLALFSGKSDKEATIDSMTGVGYKHPLIGAAMTVFLLSLAGLPPTGGFIAKYFLFASALEAGETVLVLLAVGTSLVSVYYYIRVVIYMYMREPVAESAGGGVYRIGAMAGAAIAVCALLTIQIGVAPGGILHMARKAAQFLAG